MFPFGLAEQVFRFINNLIEGKPKEIRETEAVIWFNITWKWIRPFLDKETASQVEEIMKLYGNSKSNPG